MEHCRRARLTIWTTRRTHTAATYHFHSRTRKKQTTHLLNRWPEFVSRAMAHQSSPTLALLTQLEADHFLPAPSSASVSHVQLERPKPIEPLASKRTRQRVSRACDSCRRMKVSDLVSYHQPSHASVHAFETFLDQMRLGEQYLRSLYAHCSTMYFWGFWN